MASLLLLAAQGAGGNPDRWSPEERRLLEGLWIGHLRPLRTNDFPTNRYALDPRARRLGERLFHDPRLSGDGETSCSTCHVPDQAFASARIVGGAQGRRSVPTLLGVAWQSFFFWDGRKDSLWSQALAPLESPAEHDMPRVELARFVARTYAASYEEVFGPIDRAALARAERATVDRMFANVGKAIAAFETSLVPPRNALDRYLERVFELARIPSANGEGRPDLDDCAIDGLALFAGRARCISCHHGPLFRNDHFHNTGVPAMDPTRISRGHAALPDFISRDPFSCLGEYADGGDPEEKCGKLVHFVHRSNLLLGAMKTPSLRQVSRTAPYMHGGQFATLEEVIDHYSRAPEGPIGQTELLPLDLSAEEKRDLVCLLAVL